MSGARARVLVVDDAALVRLFYRDVLEQAGFEVHEALNGIEGLEAVLGEPFDLLVVDVNMPQMDGLTFIANVRRQALPIAATPILVTSTQAGAVDFEAAERAGANSYLVKPIEPRTLTMYACSMCALAAHAASHPGSERASDPASGSVPGAAHG